MRAEFKTDNYSISTLLTLLASVGLAFALTILHALGLGELSQGIYDLVYGGEIFLLGSQLLAGNGYFFQFIDNITNHTTLFEKTPGFFKSNKKTHVFSVPSPSRKFYLKSILKRLKNDNSFVGLSIGIISAIGLTIAEILLHIATPFGALGSVLSHTILFVNNLSGCCGLGNRVGAATNYFKATKNKFRSKGVNYALGVAGGVLVGLTLTGLVLGIAGVTAISGGSALPVALFCLSMIGGCTSAAGYFGRVADFILGNRTIVGAVEDVTNSSSQEQIKSTPVPIASRINKENVLTAVGIGIGIAVGATLLLAGAATLPLFGAGLPKLVAGFLLFTFCVSAGAGSGRRLGYMLDRKTENFWQWFKKSPAENPSPASAELSNANSPMDSYSRINKITSEAKLRENYKKDGYFFVGKVLRLFSKPSPCPNSPENLQASLQKVSYNQLFKRSTSTLNLNLSKEDSSKIENRYINRSLLRRSNSMPNLSSYPLDKDKEDKNDLERGSALLLK